MSTVAPPARPPRPRRLGAVATVLVVVAAIALLHRLDQGTLAAPPLHSAGSLRRWAADTDPLTVALVVLRLAGLALAYHFVVTTALVLVGHRLRRPALVRLADAGTPRVLRRARNRSLGLALTLGAALVGPLPAALATPRPANGPTEPATPATPGRATLTRTRPATPAGQGEATLQRTAPPAPTTPRLATPGSAAPTRQGNATLQRTPPASPTTPRLAPPGSAAPTTPGHATLGPSESASPTTPRLTPPGSAAPTAPGHATLGPSESANPGAVLQRTEASGAATLRLVQPAGPPPASPPAPGPGTPTASLHQVRPGDHLWAIAEETLAASLGRAPTDAEVDPFWRQVVAANPQLVDPDLLHPGEAVAVPAPPDPRRGPDPAAPIPAGPSSVTLRRAP